MFPLERRNLTTAQMGHKTVHTKMIEALKEETNKFLKEIKENTSSGRK